MVYSTVQRNNYNGLATSTTLKLYPFVPHEIAMTIGISDVIDFKRISMFLSFL